MEILIKDNKKELGEAAANIGAEIINSAINEKGTANIILATGASQFEVLEHLVKENVEWAKVTCFHLDEYMGVDETHPASFRKYLKERFYNLVEVKDFHFINAETNSEAECLRLNKIIENLQIDVAFIGIGENGHLAFNDPPADFETTIPYIIVDLDEECRIQQFNEGWFEALENVPKTAISMSINQILKSEAIICTVPDRRKAKAVFNTIDKEVDPHFPSTILKTHKDILLFLDNESSSLIDN